MRQVIRIEENKIEKKAERKKRKSQNDHVIQARTVPVEGIGARTVEDASQSHPDEEVTDKDLRLGGGGHLDRKREDRIGSRGHLGGGGHLDREIEDKKASRGHLEDGCHLDREKEERSEYPSLLEGEGLSQRRNLFLQPCPCPHHLLYLEESVRSREILICEVS